MIKAFDKKFILSTDNTTTVLAALYDGSLGNLYYGKKINVDEQSINALFEKWEFAPGDTIIPYKDAKYSLESVKLEVGELGKGDFRDPSVVLCFPDGSQTSDFLYDSFNIEGENSLEIKLKDRDTSVFLNLKYTLIPELDIIIKSAELTNETDGKIKIERLLSSSIDLDMAEYDFVTFNGAWAREMNKYVQPVRAGKIVNESRLGASSNHANPFCMLAAHNCSEEKGSIYASNLIYSGNHYESVSVSAFNQIRFNTGINPEGFGWDLMPGESFCTPKAVLLFTDEGFSGVSGRMHKYVNNYLIKEEWRGKERPVLLNSWEANYFKISESRLVSQAKKAKALGIELFVMDDGWFGERNDDSSSLGDWYASKEKLPGGLSSLSEKIHGLGLKFGIWVEPEMVSEKSELYKNHPEWALRNPGRTHAEGRNQMVLNLALPEVQDFIIDEMSRVFSEGNVDYVKWDYNRNFSDIFINSSEQRFPQYELSHRYILGLYRIMEELTNRFPYVLFEGCASGGNRFDLGILQYFPQIWASDNTDPVCRAKIQEGYSYCYPQSSYTNHVSAGKNHQTLRESSLQTRFSIAMMGNLGYELNPLDLSKDEEREIKEEISLYKELRKTLQFGDYKRISGSSYLERRSHFAQIVSEDKEESVLIRLRGEAFANGYGEVVKPVGLLDDMLYDISSPGRVVDIKSFGSLINTMSPVHVKDGGLMQDVLAKVVKLNYSGHSEIMYGDMLKNAGLRLNPSFGGTGYGEAVNLLPENEAEFYIIRKNKKN